MYSQKYYKDIKDRDIWQEFVDYEKMIDSSIKCIVDTKQKIKDGRLEWKATITEWERKWEVVDYLITEWHEYYWPSLYIKV